MPRCEYTCLECGNSFEVFTTAEHLEDGIEVECPECGSTQTVRTYHEGDEPEAGYEPGLSDDDEEDLDVNPDDE